MAKLSQKQQKIIAIILEKGSLQSSAIHAEVVKAGDSISLVTVKRALSEMAAEKIIVATGAGRSLSYSVSTIGKVFSNVNAKDYCAFDPDKRYGASKYNFDLFADFPDDIFENDESALLNESTEAYERRIKDLSPVIQKKELERLIIELSWKSSKIEGNTYTLLDTEKLILENKEALGHEKKESQMILNHKDAFNFVRENTDKFKSLNRFNLEELHSVLVKNLDINFGLRSGPVGVTGSKYQPLDNVYQIQEAVVSLSSMIEKNKTPYAKALLALLGISYIQPFEDGNKRTARLMANALLLAYKKAPLSYRSVDEKEYREATLVFYELNSIVPFKKIFIEQYDFASRNYAVRP
ncbi:MAG: Fic family protein [Candidatus Paceibacterota bacterium]|jgi:hypothetical protein